MKKIIVLVAVFLFAVTGMVFAQVANSKHDLSVTSTGITDNTDTAQICVFCHTPHQPVLAGSVKPLWNHTIPATAYTVYSGPADLNPSATFEGVGTVLDIGAADGLVSQLCLSCHDGVTAINSLYNNPNDVGVPTFSSTVDEITPLTFAMDDATKAVGSGAFSLQDDHPMNFTYNVALQGLDNAAGGMLLAPGALPLYPGTGGLADTIQCATCHNPHDVTNPPFLRVSIAASLLCGSCHGQ